MSLRLNRRDTMHNQNIFTKAGYFIPAKKITAVAQKRSIATLDIVNCLKSVVVERILITFM